ncbi:MAG: hypothetical protein AB4372_27875 [Xenococcus sp. (in: cyanobacteria)]
MYRYNAKKQIERINQELESPHILIGGLAVGKYCPGRNSQDIDLVCSFETSIKLIDKLYPMKDWKVEELNQDDLRPCYRITHRSQEDKGEIIFGPKIKERKEYEYIEWRYLVEGASTFSVRGNELSNILVPSPHALAYTKLVSFINRNGGFEKRQQDLQDFSDLTNHEEFSSIGLYSLLEKSGSRESLTKQFLEQSRIFPEIIQNSCLFHMGSLFPQIYGENMELEQIKASLVPSGTITLWSGSPDEIPSGWFLCDGKNGTPNLCDRFVCGAGSNGPKAGSHGEADSHNHSIGSQNVSAKTNVAGNHEHRLPERWYSRDFSSVPSDVPIINGFVSQHTGIDRCAGDVKHDRVQNGGEHSHSVKFNIQGLTTEQANTGKPKWFALCYIMKQ